MAKSEQLDIRGLVGRSEPKAAEIAARYGCPFRVTERDGRPTQVHFDHRPSRVNATVEDGQVVEVYLG